METYAESFTESLMLHNAHRVRVYHSQREGLSVGQSSSSVSERTGRSGGERTGRPVRPIGQELNVGNAQIRTLLDGLFRSHDNTNLARRKDGVTPIHRLSGKSKRKARSSLNAEVQTLADAEQELYVTRLHLAEFLGFL